MARRRRSRYTWFPIVPTFVGESTTGVAWYNTATIISPDQGSTLGPPVAIPVLSDQDIQVSQATQDPISLRDRVEGKDYAIERIVGKIWASVSQEVAEDPGHYVAMATLFCAALAVLPVDDDGNPDISSSDYDPLEANNTMQPWIWRRTWTLYNNLAVPVEPQAQGPRSIGEYGSVMDGGHLDAKSARRVRREQRLFVIFQATTLQNAVNGGDPNQPRSTTLSYGYDLRVLGAMRRARNESTFK